MAYCAPEAQALSGPAIRGTRPLAGGRLAADARRGQYEQGIEARKRAIAIDPRRSEGHFWMATSMGALAESYLLVKGVLQHQDGGAVGEGRTLAGHRGDCVRRRARLLLS